MSEFSFRDEDIAPEKPQPKAPPAAPTPPVQAAPVAPVAPRPQAPANAPVPPAAPRSTALPQVPLPQAPTPQAPTPQAPTPQAPTPQVPLPQVQAPTLPTRAPQVTGAPSPQTPLPQVATPQVPQTQAPRPATGAASAPSPSIPLPAVPSPTLPTAALTPPGRGGAPSPAVPRQGAAPVQNVPGQNVPGQNAPVQGAPGVGAPRIGTPGAAGQPATAAAPKAAPSPVLPLAGSAARATAAKKNDNMPASGELARVGVKTSAREHVDDKDIPIWRTWLDKLDPFAFWLVRMGAIGGGLALAYLLYAIFGGNIGNPQIENLAQATQNVTLAGTVLRFALLAIALSLIVLMFDEKFVGVGMVILGIVLEFGSPFLIKNLGQTTATNAMARQLMTGGHWLMVAGLLKATLDSARWLFDLPNRMKKGADVGVAQLAEPAQQRAARNATMFSPCWQLPFCREVIRKQCPAFLAKTACWKFGRGCYCDEEMISRIIRGEALDLIKAPTRMSRQGKPPCGRCYIFLEHQTLKYKLISPLAIPATIGIMFVGWPAYQRLFGVATQSLGFLWEKLSFGSTATTTVTETIENVHGVPTVVAPSTIDAAYVQHAAQNMFGFLLGFFVLIYISKFIEWAIFKAKL